MRAILAGAALAVAGFVSGCYHKIVGAQGPGADTVNIEKPDAPTPGTRTLGYPRYTPKKLPGD